MDMDNELYSTGQSSADEIRRYIEQSNEGIEETESDIEEERLEEMADKELFSHNDALSVIIIAFVMVFFGIIFTALTNHQDFTEGEGFTWKRFTSGVFCAEVEKKFNSSLPLQDYFHNAESAIKYFFGTGNETDYIDIEAKKKADDPYSIEDINEYTPLPDPDADYVPVFDNGENNEETSVVTTTTNGKTKKLSGIKITTPYYIETSPDESYKTTNLNLNAPDVQHTTTDIQTNTIPVTNTTPETTTTEPETSETTENTDTQSDTETGSDSGSDTEPQSETEPAETQPPETSSTTNNNYATPVQ